MQLHNASSRGLAGPRASGGAKVWEEPEPRLSCEDDLQSTQASVEAPFRSEVTTERGVATGGFN